MKRILFAILLALLPSVAWADITTGLLVHYAFEEGTGTTAEDSTANNKDGTLTGGPTWVNGKNGTLGVQLDGTNDHIVLPTSLDISNRSALTVAVWFTPTSRGDFEKLFSHYVSDSQRVEMMLSGSGAGGNDDPQCNLSTGASAEGWTEQNYFSTGGWKHWVMVFDGSQTGNANRLKFYLDGRQIEFLTDDDPPQSAFTGTIPATTTNNAATASYIGSRGGSSSFAHGIIDEFRLYNRALTADDVKELVNHEGQPVLAVFPPSGLENYRVIKIAAGEYAYTDADDENRFGFSKGSRVQLAHSHYQLSFTSGTDLPMGGFHSRHNDDLFPLVTLEAVSGNTIAAGGIVYQAADGKVDDSGTVRVGVAVKRVQALSPELWTVRAD